MIIALLSSMGVTLDSFFPEIVQEWKARGQTVVSAASTPSHVGEFTRIRSITRRPSPLNVLAPGDVRRWLRQSRADVLITNTATASALARVGSLPVPVVYFCHGLHWNTGQSVNDRLWQAVEGRLIQRTTGTITINADDEAWFVQHAAANRILRLERGVGVPLARFAPAPVRSGQGTALLWVGEFTQRKQPAHAVQVIRHLHDRGVAARLVMLGEGPQHESVQQLVRESGLTDFVSMPGHGDVAEHLASADALVHTARWEGLPRVMLEAYARGRRSYAYDVKGVRDIPGAVLSSAAQPYDLAESIRKDVLSHRIRDFSPTLEGLDTSESASRILDFVAALVGQKLNEVVRHDIW